MHRGMPITTVPVTLICLPSLLSFENLAQRSTRRTSPRHDRPEHIETALERHPNAKGAKILLRRSSSGDAPTSPSATSSNASCDC